jgi:hypothetical protein
MNTNLVEIFLHPPTTETTSAWFQIGMKLLDWPFLIAVVLIFFIIFFQKPLKALIYRTEEFKWGEYSIRLSQLGKKFDQELDTQLDAKLEPLRNELEVLKKSSPEKKPQEVLFADDAIINEPSADALNRIKRALMSPEYRWRTISRLAAIAGISEPEATRLVRSLNVDFDVNKSGERIAKLKSR